MSVKILNRYVCVICWLYARLKTGNTLTSASYGHKSGFAEACFCSGVVPKSCEITNELSDYDNMSNSMGFEGFS